MYNKQPFGPNFTREAPWDYSEPDHNMCQKGHCWNFEIGKRCLNNPCGFIHVAREADKKNNTLCVFYAKNCCRKGINCNFRHDINLPPLNQLPLTNFGPNSFIQQKPKQFYPPPPQQFPQQSQQSQQFLPPPPQQFPQRQQPFPQRQQQQFSQKSQLQQKSQLKPAMKSPGQGEKGYGMYLQKKPQQKAKFSPKFEHLASSDEEEEIKSKKKQKTPLKAKAKIDSSDDDEDE